MIADGQEHPEPTSSERKLRYQFTDKHHGGQKGQACWLEEVTPAEEFAIFDLADWHLLRDDDGNLYGIEKMPDGTLRVIGTCGERIAEFLAQPEGMAWHGYPVYPINSDGPHGRRGFTCCPAKVVFERMREAGLITKAQQNRLRGGKG